MYKENKMNMSQLKSLCKLVTFPPYTQHPGSPVFMHFLRCETQPLSLVSTTLNGTKQTNTKMDDTQRQNTSKWMTDKMAA
ncbi:hypothetical protein FKM82_020272 [Ascaphus truei]